MKYVSRNNMERLGH